MTNEEAIERLKSDIYKYSDFTENPNENEFWTAFDKAIKALEQEPILDKIRAEIDQKQYNFMADKDYDEGIRFGLMLAYQIIDKYKAESEVQDADSN